MIDCINPKCGISSTIDRHDLHCVYMTQLSLFNDDNNNKNKNNNDYSDKWQISYSSLKQSSDNTFFPQFVFIEIKTLIDNPLSIEPLIRESCDYSFQTELTFKSKATRDNKYMIYTVILPSCSDNELEICTYYIVIEGTVTDINTVNTESDTDSQSDIIEKNSLSSTYELTASLGILLQFQQKYSYAQHSSSDNTDNGDNTDNKNDNAQDNLNEIGRELLNKLYQENENENDIQNISCSYSQFYGLKASLTDFPIGIIIQPEFPDSDASFKIHQYTSAPDADINEKHISKLKGNIYPCTYLLIYHDRIFICAYK